MVSASGHTCLEAQGVSAVSRLFKQQSMAEPQTAIPAMLLQISIQGQQVQLAQTNDGLEMVHVQRRAIPAVRVSKLRQQTALLAVLVGVVMAGVVLVVWMGASNGNKNIRDVGQVPEKTSVTTTVSPEIRRAQLLVLVAQVLRQQSKTILIPFALTIVQGRSNNERVVDWYTWALQDFWTLHRTLDSSLALSHSLWSGASCSIVECMHHGRCNSV